MLTVVVAAPTLVTATDELLSRPGHCGTTVAHDCKRPQSSGAWKAASMRACLRRCASCPRCSVASYSSRDGGCSWYAHCDVSTRGLVQDAGHQTVVVRHTNGTILRAVERLLQKGAGSSGAPRRSIGSAAMPFANMSEYEPRPCMSTEATTYALVVARHDERIDWIFYYTEHFSLTAFVYAATSETGWLGPRPAGSPEASLSARSCLRLHAPSSSQPRPIRRVGRAAVCRIQLAFDVLGLLPTQVHGWPRPQGMEAGASAPAASRACAEGHHVR